MAATSVLTGRNERFGRAALRIAAAAMLVLLVLGATMQAAGAETTTTPITESKDEFIKKCKAAGGTIMEGAGPTAGEVTCTRQDKGTSTTCNFNYWYCTTGPIPGFYPDPNLQTSTTHGTVGGGVATGGGTSSGQGSTTVRPQTAKPGTIVVLDDDDGQP
jgi:hypothetical protein